MEAFKILKRIAFYLLFIVVSTLFYREMICFSLFAYTEAWESFTFDLLAKDVFLPLLYATLSFGIALIAQFLLIGRPKEVETTIYPWTLIIYFGVGAIATVIILAIGLTKIPSEPVNKDPLFLIVPIVITLLFTLSEVLWGFLYFLKNKKKEKIQENIENEQKRKKEKEDAQVSLTKED